jgi:hypothetical protein
MRTTSATPRVPARPLNILIGIAGAVLLALTVLVPIVAAASPTSRSERFIMASGTDVTLPADQSVEVFVVFNGNARIEGEARTIFIVNGTADLVGADASTVIAVESRVNIDSASVVSGDIRTMNSTVTSAPGASVGGQVRDISIDMAFGWLRLGSVLFLIYAAFGISAIAAGVVLAGVAARQVRAATALISHEPVQVIAASFIGLIGLVTAGILAMVTVVGIPFGIGLLVFALPGLAFVGYLVAGIWVGEMVLGQTTPGKTRERPYLAAIVGLSIVAVVSLFPPFGGLISLVGLGAVVLLMWRVARGGRATIGVDAAGAQVAPAAS